MNECMNADRMGKVRTLRRHCGSWYGDVGGAWLEGRGWKLGNSCDVREK